MKMPFLNFLEIFGGAGAVLLGICGCALKYFRSFEYKYDYETEEKRLPIEVLNHNWEHQGVDFPENSTFGKNYNRQIFAKPEDGNWKVAIDKNHGSVYLYVDVDQAPHWRYNNGNHYLRVNIKNVSKNVFVEFQHKFWSENYGDSGHNNVTKRINRNGANIFEHKCLINNEPDSVVRREQIGVYISGNPEEIKNIIIDEAYYGEKWYFWNLSLCSTQKTILYRKRTENSK